MILHPAMQHDLQAVTAQFRISGCYAGSEPYGNGHINDTYIAWWNRDGQRVRTLHQRLNHNVFKEPARVMENIVRVTRHLRQRLADIPGTDPDRETLTLIPTREGAYFFRDGDGNTWRSYIFIEDAGTYDICETPALAVAAARAFGRFQCLLADLPGAPLHETIPYFHHTPRRFDALCRAVAADRCNRCAVAAAEIAFASERKALTTVVTDRLADGTLPLRITHNDTKLNNVMIDASTGQGVCVIDLDTVMPGTSLYDFGDLVRTSTRDAAEDQPDPDREIFRIDLFAALVRGYFETAGAFLTPAEIDGLVIASRLLTFTIGLRFLTDYLEGDSYFKTGRPGQNLDRARVQFQLLRHMERREADMQRVVNEVVRGGG